MVTLPVYTSTVSPDTGLSTFRPASTQDQVSAAAVDFGQNLGQLGQSVARYDARVDNFATAEAAKAGAINDGIAYQKVQQKVNDLFIKSKEAADPAATDFTKNFLEQRAKLIDDFVAMVPPERKAEWQLQISKEETVVSGQAAAFEFSRRSASLEETVKSQSEALNAMVLGGADPALAKEMAASKVRQLAGVVGGEGSPLSAELQRRFLINIESAAIERWRQTNPVQAERELRSRVAGTYEAKKADDPGIPAALDAAERYGLDPRLFISIKGSEGGYGPQSVTAKASKTIRGQWQVSQAESTAVGMGDQHYSNDPAIQAEIAARIMVRNSGNLQANGLDANFYNMKGAHWLGLGGWIAAQKTDPNTSMRDFYGRFSNNIDKTLAENGWTNKTVGQVLGDIRNMEKSRLAEADQYIGPRSAPSQEPLVVNGHKIENIPNDQLSSFYGKARADVAKLMDNTLTEMAKSKVATGDINAYNSHDRDEVHKAGFANGLDKPIIAGDTAAQAQTFLFAQKHGFVSAAESAGISNLMNNKIDQARRVQGFELGLAVHDADPQNGLDHSKFGPDEKRALQLYAKQRSITGEQPAEAIRNVDRMMDPAYKAKTEELAERIKTEKSGRTFSELSNLKLLNGQSVVGGWFSSGPSAPRDERMKDFIQQTYRDRFEFHMKDLGNNSTDATKTAKALAQWDMQRLLGVTNVSGKAELTIYPPENYYKPILIDTPKGQIKSHQYIQDQAVDLVKQRLVADKASGRDVGAVSPQNVFLRPTGDTAADIRAGRPPVYEVLYFTSKGEANVAGQLRADPMLARYAAKPEGTANAAATGKGLASARKAAAPDKTEEDAIAQNRALSQW